MMVILPDLQVGLTAAANTVTELSIYSVEFDTSDNKWLIHFSLTCDIGLNSFIQNQTLWYGLVAHTYPFGELELHPAVEGGVTVTFPHQSINTVIEGKAWLNGKLCVRTKFAVWERAGYDSEPFTAAERFVWHISRAIYWLKAAAAGQLVRYGDPFELPQVLLNRTSKFGFKETIQSFNFWSTEHKKFGNVEATYLQNTPYSVVQKFRIGNTELKYQWGEKLNTQSDYRTGIWVLLPRIAVVTPWQTPLTWGELYTAANNMKFDLRKVLYQRYCTKNSNSYSFILIGYPIPERFGESPVRIHWQGIELPPIPRIKAHLSIETRLKVQFKIMFRDNQTIQWANSENWSEEQITTRGKLAPKVKEMNILLIGCGAVGSLVAELLIRLGLVCITTIDWDTLEVGNFSRHTLDMSYLGQNKAEALATRLNTIFPNVEAKAIGINLLDILNNNPQALHSYDVIIDATASDLVMFHLEKSIKQGTCFISIATGYGARRLYLFTSRDTTDLKANFDTKVQFGINRDNAERIPDEEVVEGIGCYHPLIRARYDDITLLIGAAISHIEHFIKNDEDAQRLTVFEIDKDDSGQFIGLKCIRDDQV